ncbi:putative nADH-ubiquinone oxidoreductase, chain 49kDa [Mycobacterium xenopi 4042]|uniref:Putative nADH-ubiquinone oxidoreductase, chain 49kDa n=1 Tax=Mycobacterium xenopi 4042 TaxID=1299334 RepID=X8E8V5_MYCXE|nr:putative nADH-ubiquinone oxidoreductase, chain 49kDa [Mycobacterium xenopi 4042]
MFESIEFLIETPGEDIPHLNIRPHYKHRGIAKRFESLPVSDGILVAERVEGVASIAHALAFAHAVETLADVTPPPRARMARVIHAELERIANHLDVVMRLCDAAGIAVPTARFGWHKECVLRLVSALCGNRFGRSVVCPGGVNAEPRLTPAAISEHVGALLRRIHGDRDALMVDASFLDRLRGTGSSTRRWPARTARSAGGPRVGLRRRCSPAHLRRLRRTSAHRRVRDRRPR